MISLQNLSMADSDIDIASRLANIHLGGSGADSERESQFWNRALVAMKFTMEPLWLKAAWKTEKKPNFGMRNLDAILEERCLLKLELSGPLVDSFLKEIGKGILSKLGRSRFTGLMTPVRLHIPYNI